MPTYFASDRHGTYIPANEENAAHLTLLSSSISAKEITLRLGVAPDRSWELGAKRTPRSGHRHKYHGWQLESGIDGRAPVSDHLAALLARLEPVADAVRALVTDAGALSSARLWIVHSIENWNPGIELEANQLAAIAELGVSLALDIYVYEIGDLGPTRLPRGGRPKAPA